MTRHTIDTPRPALVGIDGLTHDAAEGNIWGYAAHVSDYRWNGWAVPFFTHAECERIAAQSAAWNAAQVKMFGAANAVDSMCNIFTFDAARGVWLEADPREGGAPDACEPSYLPDGTPVYALGNGYCWSEASETAAADAPLVLERAAREAWADGARCADPAPVDADTLGWWAFTFADDPDSDDDADQGVIAAWRGGYVAAGGVVL